MSLALPLVLLEIHPVQHLNHAKGHAKMTKIKETIIVMMETTIVDVNMMEGIVAIQKLAKTSAQNVNV